jgi:hypothetical protein
MKFKATIFLIFSVVQVRAQLNQLFPEMLAETVTNKMVSLPSAAIGKYTLIGMAYSEKAEADLRTWYQPIYSKFIAKSGLMDQGYDVNIYFIPMFTGGKKALKNTAINEFNKSDNKELSQYVLFYSGELEKYKDALSLEEKDKPYFFLLDKNGSVVFTEKGRYSDEKIEEMEDVIN